MLALLFVIGMATTTSPVLTVPPEMLRVAPGPKEVWIEKLHQCENPRNVPSIMDTNGRRSYGALMFQEQTWLAYGKPFGATRENISSSTLQKKVARHMLDNGGSGHWWHCSKRLGAYPLSAI